MNPTTVAPTLEVVFEDCLSRFHVYSGLSSTSDVLNVCRAIAAGSPPNALPLGQRKRKRVVASVSGPVHKEVCTASDPPLVPLSFSLVVVDSIGSHYWADRAYLTRASSDSLHAAVVSALKASLSFHPCAIILTRPLLFGSADSVKGLRWPGCKQSHHGATASRAAIDSVISQLRPGGTLLVGSTINESNRWNEILKHGSSPTAVSLREWTGTVNARDLVGVTAPTTGDDRQDNSSLRHIDFVALSGYMRPYAYAGYLHALCPQKSHSIIGADGSARRDLSEGSVQAMTLSTPRVATVVLTRVCQELQPAYGQLTSLASHDSLSESSLALATRVSPLFPSATLILVRYAQSWTPISSCLSESLVAICG